MIHKIKVSVGTNRLGSTVTDTLEVEIDDDTPEAEIAIIKQEAATEWMWEHIDFYWDNVTTD